MCRFYNGLHPLDVVELPPDLLEAMLYWIPVLQAEETLLGLTVSSYPHLKRSRQRSVWREFSRKVGRSRAVVIDSAEELSDWFRYHMSRRVERVRR